MSFLQLEEVYKYVPVGTTTVWVMVTGYFNRPPSDPCEPRKKIGLGFITGILALVCWIRAATSIYSNRANKRCSNIGSLWAFIAIVEGAAATSMFLGTALLTSPGSTCWFGEGPDNRSKFPAFMAYNILVSAALVALAFPRLIGWLMSLCEVFGIKTRERYPIPYPDSHGPIYEPRNCILQFYRLLEQAFLSDELEQLMWQLLPVGPVTLWQLSTAYWTGYALPSKCSADERLVLVVYGLIVTVITFFLTLESYEKDRDDPDVRDPDRLPFRRSIGYKFTSFIQAIYTTASFFLVVLLTPPGSTCFFHKESLTDSVQKASIILLLPLAFFGVVLACVKAAIRNLQRQHARPGALSTLHSLESQEPPGSGVELGKRFKGSKAIQIMADDASSRKRPETVPLTSDPHDHGRR